MFSNLVWSDEFEGTTLRATNAVVDAYNMRRLRQLPGDSSRIHCGPDPPDGMRWVAQPSRVGETYREDFLFKIGAYVMILSE